ncbi:hypothetical protein [Deinococcus rufus]|uniref:Uncharacterized protein n=1 Tax=Deinococcus rufus TaxID=2136097 RepID=A0ABV7Z929_9DEIO
MTLIAAVIQDGQVCMLGDSMAGDTASGGYHLTRQPKVFPLGPLLVGYTSSFRMGQILTHGLKTPSPSGDLGEWLRGVFIDRVRRAFERSGYGDGKNSTGGTFLIAGAGRIFVVQDDFAVLESTRDYAAVGAGVAHAEGVLGALGAHGLPPQERLLAAARAAQAHNVWVAPPWHLRWSHHPDDVLTVPA